MIVHKIIICEETKLQIMHYIIGKPVNCVALNDSCASDWASSFPSHDRLVICLSWMSQQPH